jgi:2Fe-2S ferredoxin
MPKVTFIAHDGQSQIVEASNGSSMMRIAVTNGVRGIVAECGGAMMCGTCHVYVSAEWINRLPPPGDTENLMLDMTVAERRSNSRLSCQIAISDAIDGIVATIPDHQV